MSFSHKPFITILLVLAGIVMSGCIFFPLWKIELYAPQYPEGLVLLIHADTLGGNVDIINGLNHYIGMQELDSNNFPEFTVLPYLIGFWSIVMLIVGITGNKKWLNILMFAFIAFSLVAMADFYRWNYNYGHHLNPDAAIKVPGMSYQPPLIGYKQLLNFGAYAMPASGGWCYIVAGVLIFIAFMMENKILKFFSKKRKTAPVTSVLLLFMFLSCTGQQPRAVRLNEDACAYCKMTINDQRFTTQVISKKGRQYLFDDISCMMLFRKDHTEISFEQYYAADFCAPHDYVAVEMLTFMASDSLRSPMGGNIAGFTKADSAKYYQQKFTATQLQWADINK